MVLGKFSDGASEPTVLALVAGGELGCFFFFFNHPLSERQPDYTEILPRKAIKSR